MLSTEACTYLNLFYGRYESYWRKLPLIRSSIVKTGKIEAFTWAGAVGVEVGERPMKEHPDAGNAAFRWSLCCGGRRRFIPKCGARVGTSGRGEEARAGAGREVAFRRRLAEQACRRSGVRWGGVVRAQEGSKAAAGSELGRQRADNLWEKGIEPFEPN
jgi:hypothetical protein